MYCRLVQNVIWSVQGDGFEGREGTRVRRSHGVGWECEKEGGFGGIDHRRRNVIYIG